MLLLSASAYFCGVGGKYESVIIASISGYQGLILDLWSESALHLRAEGFALSFMTRWLSTFGCVKI